jgi:hypothetical protein
MSLFPAQRLRLITSTILSLVFLPVVFVYMDMLRLWLGRKLARLTSVTEEDRKASANP